jgi:transposase
MWSMRTAVLAAMGMVAAAAPALAQEGAWVSLAERTLSDTAGSETINVRNRSQFRQLQICVDSGAVRFLDVNVRFANDAVQNIRLRNRIAAGHCSRILDLRGRDRSIGTIELVYEAASLGGQSAAAMVLAR